MTEARMSGEIRAGDVVMRKGGGALMRVSYLAKGNAVCEWWTPRGPRSGQFPVADLKRLALVADEGGAAAAREGMTDWAEWGASLRREREAAGMSTAALAERLGVKRPTLNGIESGKAKPGPDVVRRARRVFDGLEGRVRCGHCGAEY